MLANSGNEKKTLPEWERAVRGKLTNVANQQPVASLGVLSSVSEGRSGHAVRVNDMQDEEREGLGETLPAETSESLQSKCKRRQSR